MSISSPPSIKFKHFATKLHKELLGLELGGVFDKSYPGILLRHLWQLLKNSSSDSHRRRAQVILIALAFISIGAASTISYTLYKLLSRFKSGTIAANRRPSLRRTRSQMLLDNGAREMYIPYQNDNKSKKRILIKSNNEDSYEHDKFLFKYLGKNKTSQLFYSRFLNQLSVLSRILVPKLTDRNSVLLSLQIFFLIMRTWLSLFVARLDGQIVRDIIAGRGRKFMLDLVCWFLIAFPASYTNSAIKFLQRKLSLNFRVNLTRYIHDIYLDKRLAFYKLAYV